MILGIEWWVATRICSQVDPVHFAEQACSQYVDLLSTWTFWTSFEDPRN